MRHVTRLDGALSWSLRECRCRGECKDRQTNYELVARHLTVPFFCFLLTSDHFGLLCCLVGSDVGVFVRAK